MNNISYDEIMSMLYLSQLIYDYHTNNSFNLTINESIIYFLKKNDISNQIFDSIRQPLTYLANNMPYGKIIKFISEDETDTQVGIVIDEINKKLCIVFRGTESFKDCLYDIDFYEKKYRHCGVHAGFYYQVKSVKKNILDTIEPYVGAYDIYLTGHSLGGANATLFSYMLSEKYYDLSLKLVTFGSPRIGNHKWKQSFENKKNIINIRITNKRDLVTVIPCINYCHVGKHIYLDDDNIYFIDDKSYYSLYCRSILHSFNVNDHKILNYAKNLLNKKHLWNNIINSIDENNSSSDDNE
jgi:hypothetical protein